MQQPYTGAYKKCTGFTNSFNYKLLINLDGARIKVREYHAGIFSETITEKDLMLN